MKRFAQLIFLLCAVAAHGQFFFGQQGVLVAPAEFNPADIAGMRLWLNELGIPDAVSSTTENWSDQSGNGYTATQATGSNRATVVTVNGLKSLQFDGVNDNYTVSSFNPGGNAGMTVFVVLNATAIGAFDYGVMLETSTDYNANAGALILYNGDGNLFQVGSKESGNSLFRYGSAQTGSVKVLSATLDRAKSTNENTLWVDGVSSGSRPLNDNLTGAFDTFDLYIGARGGSSLYQPMILCEVIIYDSALGTSDREAVEAWLTTKWGL